MAPQRNIGAGAEAELPEYAGHYRLESCLGSGGMGVVHLARSTSGMKLAVKVVHAEFARDPEFRGRFRQEIAAARRVSGAFTAPVVDADPDAGRPWMATQFIPGPTLAEQVKRNGAMAPEQLRRLMAGLAEALRDIHRVGVVHRDLKPSNVLLAEDGPKVIDFGISRPKDSELRTETGKLIGTPPFMAPEQFRRPREVGPAADIFALGSVMVHAATGRGPFDSDSPYVVAYQVVHDEPDLTGVPENLAPLISRCLAKEPEDRPGPDELMRELRSVSAAYDTQTFIPAQRTGEEVREAPEAEPEPVAEPERRRAGGLRGRAVAVAAGAVGLAVIAALASAQLLGGDEQRHKDGGAAPAARVFQGWEAAPAEDSGTPQCSYGTEQLLCSQPGLVFALDPAEGRLLWRHTDSGDRTDPPALAGGLVQTGLLQNNRITALDPATGKNRWQRSMPPFTGLQHTGGGLLLTHTDGTVSGIDGASGDTRWRHPIAGHKAPYFVSFTEDPLAYAVSRSDDGQSTRVTAVDPDTGGVRWDVRLDGALQPIGVHGGSVFFLSVGEVEEAKSVVRYTPRGGARQQVKLPVPIELARGTVRGNVAYLMGVGGSLVAVDLELGKLLWTLETGVSRGSSPAADGRHVYVTTPDGRLLAVGARSGRLVGQTSPRLSTKAAAGVAVELPDPVVVGDRVYAAAPDGTVFAVDARDPARW
ncbi:protein kinase domain-containing protein [Streptomyces broussonetiae]|uniref:Serine/threonine-protein kinase n=1 Tax=Streptomyces broussonetiae TaxID=2686304 RepID=A0ABV5EIX9_9ACTN